MPDWAKVSTAVEVERDLLPFNVDVFNGPPSCIVCLHLLYCGRFPVYLRN